MNRIDTPIMLLFFNRPDVLKSLFEWVRQVKPKQLFLVQDGAREGNEVDAQKILECRKVVENVDWDCDVKTNYAEVNLSCDPREYSGIDWCFQYVDRLIVLEDDCLPSLSFYTFCGEMLEKYKDDERVALISGFNRSNHYTKSPYDYVFSHAGSGIGWATWRRVWEKVRSVTDRPLFESQGEFDYYQKRMRENAMEGNGELLTVAERSKMLNEQCGKVTSWEILLGTTVALSSALVITPVRNLIKYNGITEGATHCRSDAMLLTKKIRKIFTQCAYEIEFPLRHPPYVMRDKNFEKADRKAFVQKSKVLVKVELFFNALRAGRFDIITARIKRKFKKK